MLAVAVDPPAPANIDDDTELDDIIWLLENRWTCFSATMFMLEWALSCCCIDALLKLLMLSVLCCWSNVVLDTLVDWKLRLRMFWVRCVVDTLMADDMDLVVAVETVDDLSSSSSGFSSPGAVTTYCGVSASSTDIVNWMTKRLWAYIRFDLLSRCSLPILGLPQSRRAFLLRFCLLWRGLLVLFVLFLVTFWFCCVSLLVIFFYFLYNFFLFLFFHFYLCCCISCIRSYHFHSFSISKLFQYSSRSLFFLLHSVYFI